MPALACLLCGPCLGSFLDRSDVRLATFGPPRKPIFSTRVLAPTQTNSAATRNGSQPARIEGLQPKLCTSPIRSSIRKTVTSRATTRIPSSFLFLTDGLRAAEAPSLLTMARCSLMFLWTGPLEHRTRGSIHSCGRGDFRKPNGWQEHQQSSPLRSRRDSSIG
jgi:hypothetical protein